MAADPLDGDQRPDQQDQFRRDVQVVVADEADQLAEQGAQRDRLEVELGIGGDQLAEVAMEPSRIHRLAADVEPIEGPEDAIGVLGEQANQEIGDPLPGHAVEPAEHPVIQRRR